MDEYHLVSDAYMDTILARLEQLQESREDVDVEFSVCALCSSLTLFLSHL